MYETTLYIWFYCSRSNHMRAISFRACYMQIVRFGNMLKAGRRSKRWADLPSGECQDAFFPKLGEGAMTCGPVREAAGGFKGEPSLGAAVDDLLMSGFDRPDISVLVGRRRVGRTSGAVINHAAEWAYEPEAPSATYVGNDARSQAKATVVAGLGYLSVISLILDQHPIEYTRQKVVRAGLRLWVHTAKRDRKTPARHILKRQATRDVGVRDVVHAGRTF